MQHPTHSGHHCREVTIRRAGNVHPAATAHLVGGQGSDDLGDTGVGWLADVQHPQRTATLVAGAR